MQDQFQNTYLKTLTFEFIKDNPSVVLVFFVFMMITALQDIALPHFTGKIVNAIQQRSTLLKPFIIVLSIVCSIQVLNTYSDWLDVSIFPNMQSYVREKVLTRILEFHKASFTDMDVASLIVKLTRFPFNLIGFIDQFRYYVIPQTFVFIIAFFYILRYDLWLALAVLITFTIIVLSIIHSPEMCSESAQTTERIGNRMADEIDDLFTNMISVYSQNTENQELQRLGQYHSAYVKYNKETLSCAFLIKITLIPVVLCFICFFMYRCYKLLMSKLIDTGMFVSLFMIMFYLTNSLWRLISIIREVAPRWGRMKESLSIFEKTELPKARDDTVPIHGIFNPIEFRSGLYLQNIKFSYTNGVQFINNISLHIPPKQKIAIIGKIGSGKSTLIKLIMRYYIPVSGEIYWNGKPYSQLTAQGIRDRIGYVHQYPVLFNRTVYENIVYGLPHDHQVTKEKIDALLTQVGMPELFQNMPQGLDSSVGRKGSSLSGGQRQMVWILRIMFHNPDIIILDEPTASIDDATKQVVQRMLQLVMKDRTVIIVTHDAFLMDKVDRIITIDNGSIVNDTNTNPATLYVENFSSL